VFFFFFYNRIFIFDNTSEKAAECLNQGRETPQKA